MASIDRRGLVGRHAVEVTGIEPAAPLSVGNGEFCCTVDATGLQTFPELYPVENRDGPEPGTLLATMSQWGWHSHPGSEDLADTYRSYDTPRGPVPYVDMRGEVTGTGEAPASRAESWLRNNPHRLDLARIGFVLDGQSILPGDVTAVRQRLDLWTGVIESRFLLRGTPVRVTTACHPERDVLAVRVESTARLEVRIAFPYGSESWSVAADWSRPDAHTSTVYPIGLGCTVDRVLDGTRYTVNVGLPAGSVRQTGPHELLVSAAELTVGFNASAGFTETVEASERSWAAFWESGGAVELAGSADPRAHELERRIVLSQYLTRVHCAGSLPPQETGLMVNSWRGRFHLEMHWWHAAHFALWGRPELLERSLGWYTTALPGARATARRQGCAGARWPKQVGPDGRESPSPIGPFLIWQQPHPIHLAELVRRATGTREALERYAELVFESAAFMATYPVKGQLGPPLVPAQESYGDIRATVTNPTFELAYWSWGLRVAQRWRALLGLPPEPLWTEVADGLAPPHVRDGVYTAIDVPPYTVVDDHPSMLYALGVVPPTDLIDPTVMRATLRSVLSTWDWPSTWGWDYPAIAMTATRLGEPEAALDALLMPVEKNTHLPNGHNRQTPSLPIYLPGNGGLLAAVALMAAGWEGGPPTPGFPARGWRVRYEGLHPSP